jgi:hypothetical protein
MGTFFRSVCEAVRADGRGRACPENYGGSDVYDYLGHTNLLNRLQMQTIVLGFRYKHSRRLLLAGRAYLQLLFLLL